MKNFILITLCLSSLSIFSVDFDHIKKDLPTKGVEGWVHGAVGDRSLFAFTYRNPENFFDYLIFSLVTENSEILAKLKGLNRHDKVKVTGSILDMPVPQKHIKVASIEITKKFESGHPTESYQYEAEIPKDLIGKSNANFLVHTLADAGHILVVEYKDAVLPIFVRNAELVKNLYRGDIVNLEFKLQKNPNSPTHLKLIEDSATPVKMVEEIKKIHGTSGSIEGALILFPKSPEIKFNVFAIQQNLPDGLMRQFTIVNFDNVELFAQIRAKLQAAWDRNTNTYVNGRNKLLSTRIKVKATGMFNVVDASQANPQVLLNSLEAIQVISE